MKDKTIKMIKDYLKRKKEIIFVYVFGSYLESENPRDIDIGIYVDEEKVKDFFEYSLELMAKLSFKTGKHVDVQVLNSAPLSFLKNAIQGEVLFSRNEKFREEFVERILREYMDYYELSKEFLKEILNG